MRAVNLLLAGALVALVAAHAFVRSGPDTPGREVMPGMVYSPAAESFAPSPVMPAGRVLVPSPEGTVARQASLVRYEPTREAALRAGEELVAPPLADGDLARGEAAYATFCTPCHGAAGLGDGPVVERGFPPPPSLLAPRAMEMRDGQLFHIVTWGQNNMPGYASQIPEADRWRIVAHVRALQRKAP